MKSPLIWNSAFSQFNEYYIRACNECGICFENCFAYKNTKYRLHKVLKNLFQNKLDKKDVKKVKKFMKSCIYCKSCEVSCINGLDLSTRLAAIRFMLFKFDKNYSWLPHNLPSIFTKYIDGKRIAYFLRNLNNYIIPKKKREQFEEHRKVKSRDILFFSGCGIQMLENQYHTLVEILIKLNLNFGLIEGSYDKPVCCGAVLFDFGQFEYGTFLLNNLVDEIKKYDTKKVLVYCATCYYGLKKLAPQLVENYDLEIIYAADYIAELLKSEKYKNFLTNPDFKSKIFTIHDSCHLAHSGDVRSIRNLFSSLPEIYVSEMKHNKTNSLCDLYCLIRELDNPLKLILKKDLLPIIDEAVETKANALCSLCPGCHAFLTIFGDGLSSSLGFTKKRIVVKNWVSILGEYLGIRRKDMLSYRLSHFITIPFKESGLWYLLQILKALVRGYIGLKGPKIKKSY